MIGCMSDERCWTGLVGAEGAEGLENAGDGAATRMVMVEGGTGRAGGKWFS